MSPDPQLSAVSAPIRATLLFLELSRCRIVLHLLSPPASPMRRIYSLLALASVLAACSKNSPPEAEPVPEKSVRLADNLEKPIARGDCKEATRRAVAQPDLDVDRVAAPLAMTPAPIDMKKAPKGV